MKIEITMEQNNQIEQMLTEKVGEKYLSVEIIEAKNQMEVADRVNRLHLLARKREQYKQAIYEIEEERKQIKRILKKFCKHTEVTEYIQNGWDRAEHSYQCNHCKQSVRIHDEFSYKNIVKKVNM